MDAPTYGQIGYDGNAHTPTAYRVRAPASFDDEDKKTILEAMKDTEDWIDANGQNATADDLERSYPVRY
jgi:hypothetical protein